MMLFDIGVATELLIHSYHLWHEAKMHVFPCFDIWPRVTFTGQRQWFSMASLLLPLPPPHFFSHTTPSRFHNDGRMLDVFQRLAAKEGTYFLPQDLELSNQELSYIVKKAEQWRGFNGERRKVNISPHCSLSCLSRQRSSPQTSKINWANGCFVNERMRQKVTDSNLFDWSVYRWGITVGCLLPPEVSAMLRRWRKDWLGRDECDTEGTFSGSHDGITLFINTTFNLVTLTKILRPRGCIEESHFISLHFL